MRHGNLSAQFLSRRSESILAQPEGLESKVVTLQAPPSPSFKLAVELIPDMGTVRYVASELRENYRNRLWWRSRFRERVISPFQRRLHPGFSGSKRVIDMDWDTLVILDACRADVFERETDLNRFDGYRRERSLGSATADWMERNFAGTKNGDIVYVAGNPNTSSRAGDAFHDIVEVWRTGFDEELGTVTPEPIVAATRSARERYPNKRIIAHFMQPHYPFIGSDVPFNYWDLQAVVEGDSIETPWDAMALGKVSTEAVWEAYRSNLTYVIDYVYDLLEDLDEKVVVSSDHGNMFGERGWPFPMRIYGHPRNLRYSELISVPWAIKEAEQRPVITDDGVNVVQEPNSAEVTKRL